MTVTTVSLTLAAASSASAAFQGPYAPINWTFTNSDADGFVDTTGAPASISLTGGTMILAILEPQTTPPLRLRLGR